MDITVTSTGTKLSPVRADGACAVSGPYVSGRVVSNSNAAVANFVAVNSADYYVAASRGGYTPSNGVSTIRYRMVTSSGDGVTFTSKVTVDLPVTVTCASNNLEITTPGRKERSIRPSSGTCAVPGPYQSVQILSNSNPSVAAFGNLTNSYYYADPATDGQTTFRYRAWQADGDSAILTSVVTVDIPKHVQCIAYGRWLTTKDVVAHPTNPLHPTLHPQPCEVTGPFVSMQYLRTDAPGVTQITGLTPTHVHIAGLKDGGVHHWYKGTTANGDTATIQQHFIVQLPPPFDD